MEVARWQADDVHAHQAAALNEIRNVEVLGVIMRASQSKSIYERGRIVVTKSPLHSLTSPEGGSECKRLIATVDTPSRYKQNQRVSDGASLIPKCPTHATSLSGFCNYRHVVKEICAT